MIFLVFVYIVKEKVFFLDFFLSDNWSDILLHCNVRREK